MAQSKSSATSTLTGVGGRVAIVDALRTPFARIATHFRDHNVVDLGAMAVAELAARNNLDADDIDQIVFGQTIMAAGTQFIGREVALACGMPDVDAYSVTRACATSFQTTANAAESILLGRADVVVAGGADSTSDAPIPVSKKLAAALRDANFAKTMSQRVKILSRLRPKDLLPTAPAITEYSTGLLMGESAEQMAKSWGVTRAEQDDIAHASHSNAARAWAEGRMDDFVISAFLDDGKGGATPLREDNLVRTNSKREGYDKLKPVFDRKLGTVTAANSSPLTDGGAAMVLMSEKRAKALGYEPLAYIRGYAFAAKTPESDLLMGPVLATPSALEQAGVALKDLDLIDMHEAFAAQIACNLRGLASKDYIRKWTGRDQAVGEVDTTKLNVNGGSIAYGHPFGATGARVIGQTAHELKRRGGGLALTTACAAGGIGAAMVIESA
ncbi:acetyl-CoA C-acyltransferase FadI [Spectribacter hydrogenoxidans]|uniref:Acetyl-CoA C-acyltransferase FadI n=1 Tax=Spectribacter hydrogenoxidans TaxID=3075608 RepID=A0ABU3BX62_9GAMM|nr:acetyl-CoA C-acyltransferase FadI [Salinisphaera sp. W335]MDT0633898.1 acetyl-CoA C-acyltransferase FadI [Salinisphaera sp. W335]